MSVFTNTFGGSTVSPADVAYASYTFNADLVLFWPAFSDNNPNIAARFMDMTATDTSLNVFMPDAMLTSVGQDVIIFNAGSLPFNVVDMNGGAIATITTGQTYYILLNDNTTTSGTWQTVQFGVGTGSASAAALAGNGLIAIAGLLNTNFAASFASTDYTIAPGNRAILQVWTGGMGTITLPTAASVGDGFFFPIANNGSGSITIALSGSDTIDGEMTSVFTQTQSGFIISSGADWYTVGKGLQNNFAVTLLNLNVAGSSDITETSAQAQNIIQQYTGVLTGNINVIVPATVQLYYVFNDTSGSFSLTVKTASGTGVVIPQGTHVIVYCDGTNVINAFTSNTVTVGSVFYSLGVVGGTANALTGSASGFVLQVGTFVTFIPSVINTGPATLNVQSTGNIPLVKEAATGLVPLDPQDLIPTLPTIGYYNGSVWVCVNLIYEGNYETESADFALTFGNWLNSINCTAALNITLDVTTLFPTYFYTTIFANGGDVTLIPDAADSIQGLSVGTHFVIPRGASARLATNGVGVWTLFLLTAPYTTNDATSNITVYPTWVTDNGNNLPLKTSKTKLAFNPSTGILTATGFAGALANNSVTNAILAQMPSLTIKGNNTNSLANAADLTVSQVQAMLNGPKGYQKISASTTFVTPSDTLSSTLFKFTITAPGGGGGGGVNNGAGGAGGGAGATAIFATNGLPASTNCVIVIGSVGAAGAIQTTGGTGGNATLTIGATVVTVPGGNGGTSSAGNNNPGGAQTSAPTNATLGVTGGAGLQGITGTGAAPGFGGNGGASYWGGGAQGVGGTPANGVAATVYGAGGGGGMGNSQTGGAGGPGIVIVEWA